MTRTLAAVALLAVAALATPPIDVAVVKGALEGQALVDHINGLGTTWKAKLNARFLDRTIEQRSRMNGVLGDLSKNQEMFAREGILVEHSSMDVEIPASFDSRTAWPKCADIIGRIRDQSDCGSCWSFSTGEVISDRICIATDGAQKVDISSDDILSCCGMRCGNGCNGGYPLQALNWYVNTGVVSGGGYLEKTGCKPYPMPPCEHHNSHTTYEPCPAAEYDTPKCEKSCQAGYPTSYAQDKHFGKQAYGISRKVADIQKEIMTNGPVGVAFTVYEDFEQYESGIYQHKTGRNLGGHAVKMIGWGSENGVDYWIINNSWNEDWGEQGTFRMIRGTNDCGIEASAVAALPKV